MIAVPVGGDQVVDLREAGVLRSVKDSSRIPSGGHAAVAGVDQERLTRRRHDERGVASLHVDDIDVERFGPAGLRRHEHREQDNRSQKEESTHVRVPANHESRITNHKSQIYCPPRPGCWPPTKKFRPSAVLTSRPATVLEPFFARNPCTVSSTPSLKSVWRTPARINAVAPPASTAQVSTLPSGLLTSMCSQPCGLTHSSFDSVPFRVISLLASNSAANEW